MKILIAEDDPMACHLLSAVLAEQGYETTVVFNGNDALTALLEDNGPKLAIIDWMMPGMDGPQVCRLFRDQQPNNNAYLILLTGRESKKDIVNGLKSGANDYIVKPYDFDELKARIGLGKGLIQMQEVLLQKQTELESALELIDKMWGLLPICSQCYKIPIDENYRKRAKAFIENHPKHKHTQIVCRSCLEELSHTNTNQS